MPAPLHTDHMEMLSQKFGPYFQTPNLFSTI